MFVLFVKHHLVQNSPSLLFPGSIGGRTDVKTNKDMKSGFEEQGRHISIDIEMNNLNTYTQKK